MLLYDGDCAFCERSVTWLAAQSATTARATTWQRVDLADFDLSEHDCRRAVQWVDAETGSRTSGAFALGILRWTRTQHRPRHRGHRGEPTDATRR